MELYVKCDCGWELRAEETVLIGAVREHGSTRHDLMLSDEQILAVARPVDPQNSPPPRKSHPRSQRQGPRKGTQP